MDCVAHHRLWILGSVLEEVIFRGLATAAFESRTQNRFIIVLGPACAFGMAHWSMGLPVVIHAMVIGGIFSVLFLRCRNIAPLIVAHYCINVVGFTGVLSPAGAH